MTTWKRPRCCAAWVATVAFLLFAGGPVHAQGHAEAMPRAISSAEIDRYAHMLGLSDEQRLAIDEVHAAYRDAFAELAEERFDQVVRDAERFFDRFLPPEYDDVKRVVAALDETFDQVAALDRRFFDDIQSLLTEQQVERMPRVELDRDRELARFEFNRHHHSARSIERVDLSAMLHELEPGLETRERLEPIMVEYERSLTRRLQALARVLRRRPLDMLDHHRAAGGDAVFMSREAFEAALAAYDDKRLEQIVLVSDLHRRTLLTLARELPPLDAEVLASRYAFQAYQGGWKRAPFAATVGLDLSDQQRAEVDQIISRRWARLVPLVHQLLEAHAFVDANRRSTGPGAAVYEQFQQKEKPVQAQIEAANDAALDELRAVLGDERVAALSPSWKPPPLAVQPVLTRRGRISVEGPPPSRLSLPMPLAREDVEQIARCLALDGAATGTLVQRFETDYQPGISELSETLFAEIATRNLERFRKQDLENPPSVEEVDELLELREQFVSRLAALDDELFRSIESLAGADRATEVYRLRSIVRRASRAVPPQGHRSGDLRSSEDKVDLASLCYFVGDHVAPPGELDEALQAYGQEADALLDRRLEAIVNAIRVNLEAAVLTCAMLVVRERDGEQVLTGEHPLVQAFMQQEIDRDAAGARVGRARLAVTELNRRTLQELRALVEPETWAEIADRYHRTGFPHVYRDRDGSALEARLQEAARRTDLAPTQQQELETLIVDHRGAYDALCRRMCEVHTQGFSITRRASQDPDQESRKLELTQLQFQRSELVGATTRRLDALLGNE